MTQKNEIRILIIILLLQLVIYLPNVGRGFIKDDFVWIDNAVTHGETDWLKSWREHTGFYRPLVGTTFALQYSLHELNPLPYGLFNLFLHTLILLLLYLLLRSWPAASPYALAVTLLTSFNAKAVRMAVCWISGRTTLMFTFFLLLAFLVHIRLFRQIPKSGILKNMKYIVVSLLYFLSLLSKEEAAAAPVFIFLFLPFLDRERFGKGIQGVFRRMPSLLLYIIPLTVYFGFRFHSRAYLPFNAPDYYRFNFSPALILKNLSEYIQRAGLFDIYLLVIAGILFFIFRRTSDKIHFPFSIIVSGLLFFLVMHTTTLFLPVRSDLYAYASQAGLHLAAAVLLFHWIRPALQRPLIQKRMVLALFMVFSGFWLTYLYQKAVEYRYQGQASSRFSGALLGELPGASPGAFIEIIDNSLNQTDSPLTGISYGFNAQLALLFPGMNLQGVIHSGKSSGADGGNSIMNRHSYAWCDQRLIKLMPTTAGPPEKSFHKTSKRPDSS